MDNLASPPKPTVPDRISFYDIGIVENMVCLREPIMYMAICLRLKRLSMPKSAGKIESGKEARAHTSFTCLPIEIRAKVVPRANAFRKYAILMVDVRFSTWSLSFPFPSLPANSQCSAQAPTVASYSTENAQRRSRQSLTRAFLFFKPPKCLDWRLWVLTFVSIHGTYNQTCY